MKVTYIDHMGSDLSVVNAARVSFGKKSYCEQTLWVEMGDWSGDVPIVNERDTKLIQFLARGCTSGDWESLLDDIAAFGFDHIRLEDEEPGVFRKQLTDYVNYARKMPDHWTPFGHTAITLHIKAPIFVARQLGKHQVGFVWNEVSRRYVDDIPECYEPTYWRPSAESVKQGSVDTPIGSNPAQISDYGKHIRSSVELYCDMINDGVCAEQARMVLPQSMYTEWYWTGNLYGFANVFIQRTDSHAQKEVQDVAHQIGDIIKPLFPVSWAALTGETQ